MGRTAVSSKHKKRIVKIWDKKTIYSPTRVAGTLEAKASSNSSPFSSQTEVNLNLTIGNNYYVNKKETGNQKQGGGRCRTHKDKGTSIMNLKILHFNCQELAGEGGLLEVESVLEKIKWDIVGISEPRREGEKLTVRSNGNLLYHYDQTKGHRRGGGWAFTQGKI